MYTPINENPSTPYSISIETETANTLAEGIMLPGMNSEMQQQHAQLASLAAKHHQHQLSGALNALHQQQQQQLQQQPPQQQRSMMTGNGGMDISGGMQTSGGYLGDDGRPPPPPHSSLMQQQHQQHLNGADINGSHCHLLYPAQFSDHLCSACVEFGFRLRCLL